MVGGKISALLSNPPFYEMRVTSYAGTFEAKIDDRLGKIMVISFMKVSDKTCYDVPETQILGNGKIKGMDQFITEQFQLEGYSLHLVQENVGKDSSTLRFLYVNDKYMQIVINLSVTGQTARLVNAYLMNYGYGILQPNDPQFARILSYLKNIDIAGSKIPFYT